MLFSLGCKGQVGDSADRDKTQEQTMSITFVGDIMGHSPQINSAYNPQDKTYNYDPVFQDVAPIIKRSDFAIGNLEVTLAGAPYTGYPTFSSPDQLAVACKNSGIGAFVTANNHACDRRKKGIVRTIEVLDSLNIKRTGTFKDKKDRQENNLLILEKNSIRVGILNYTYGTNGIPVPEGVFVNLLDKELISKDIEEAKKRNLDKIIAFVHWGDEYKTMPNDNQREMANFLTSSGVDIVIGSHPHVVEPMEYYIEQGKEQLVVYSLGNFISNQRNPYTDGGIMFELEIKKEKNNAFISKKGYYLTWVDRYFENGKNNYKIVPCFDMEKKNFKGMSKQSLNSMKIYMKNVRELFEKNNINVSEITQ